MNSRVLTLIACTPIVGGWVAVTVCLDRAWGDEQEWIRRYRWESWHDAAHYPGDRDSNGIQRKCLCR